MDDDGISGEFIQRCCLFIGLSLITISFPFIFVDELWSLFWAYWIFMTGFVLTIITVIHICIFGDGKL